MATILGLIFAATQVYAEGDHLVRVTRNLINTTVSQHPELNQLLPEGWQSMMNSMVGNAFQYGREYLANVIRDSMSDSNPEKAEQIEIQVIELWDRIYMAWNQTWENAFTNVTHKRRVSWRVKNVGCTPQSNCEVSCWQGSFFVKENQEGIEWNDLLETGKEVPNLLELSVLTDYARANVGTLWSIMDALWKILIGNISLAISALYSILSLLFGGMKYSAIHLLPLGLYSSSFIVRWLWDCLFTTRPSSAFRWTCHFEFDHQSSGLLHSSILSAKCINFSLQTGRVVQSTLSWHRSSYKSICTGLWGSCKRSVCGLLQNGCILWHVDLVDSYIIPGDLKAS